VTSWATPPKRLRLCVGIHLGAPPGPPTQLCSIHTKGAPRRVRDHRSPWVRSTRAASAIYGSNSTARLFQRQAPGHGSASFLDIGLKGLNLVITPGTRVPFIEEGSHPLKCDGRSRDRVTIGRGRVDGLGSSPRMPINAWPGYPV